MQSTRESSVYGQTVLHPPDDIVAGSVGTWTLTYTVGKHGIDDGGAILIARRLANDWGIPQLDRPAEAGYTTVTTTGRAKLRVWYDRTAHIRPWKAALVIRVFEGALAAGDQVTATLGDRRGGGPGIRAQTFPETVHEFRILVDCFGTGQFVLVPFPRTVRIISGPACRLRVMAPSHAAVGEPFAVTVKAEDPWGNPACSYTGAVKFRAVGNEGLSPPAYHYGAKDGGVHRFENVVLSGSGIQRLVVEDEANGFQAESNPIECSEKAPALKLYWGDIHGQTVRTVGTGTVEEYFRYGRNAAALDFISHCANDFQVTNEHYAETQDVVKRYQEPGRFVTFPGYEWSGNTPAGGDHNVYFLHDAQPIRRSSHWQLPDRSDEETDCYPISALCETFRGRDDVLIVPHIGGRPANLDYHDPALSPVIEIQSVHGLFYWFAEEALRRGLRVGFIASSDDHTGRPGAVFPTGPDIHFGMHGGLVAAYATDLTREAVWEAIKRRRCYGTTGERIILSVTADGHPMGEEFRAASPPHLSVRVTGTAPLESVELYRGLERVYSHTMGPVETGRRLKVVWKGARTRGRGREAVWNGGLTLEGGVIVAAHNLAFDCPTERIVENTAHAVRWQSRTFGNTKGVLLDIDASADAVLAFDAGPCRFSVVLDELRHGPKTVEAGGVDLGVEVSWAVTQEGPREVGFEYVDEELKPGVNPYYVRVRQVDGGMAWSSPIYVAHDECT